MDLRHLRYFVTIADAGSFRKASERLHVAQPSLSVHVGNLEVELGGSLFERGSRGIALTPLGAVLYQRASALLRQYNETFDFLKHWKSMPTGEVAVGLPSSLAPAIAADIYRGVRDRLPGVTLHVTDASTAMLYDWLIQDRLDLCILFNLPDDPNLVSMPLQGEEVCLVSRTGEVDVDLEIDFARLFDKPLILPSFSTTWRQVIEDAATRHGRKLVSVLECDSFAMIRAIVMEGEASALLPRSSVVREVAAGSMVAQRLVNPHLRGTLSLVSSSAVSFDPAKRAVRSLLGEVMAARTDLWPEWPDSKPPAPSLKVKPGHALRPARAVRRSFRAAAAGKL